MDKHANHPITTSTERNPLRPYYIPPSIGPAPSASASPSQPIRAQSNSYSSTARDFLPELDLDLKGGASEAWTSTRSLIDSLAWRYTSVLLAQPFDVAKTVLQVSLPPSSTAAGGTPRRKRSPRAESRRSTASRSKYEVEESESEESDTPDYFTSSAPSAPSRSPRKRRRTRTSASQSPPASPTPAERRRKRSQTPDASSESSPHLPLKRIDSINHTLGILYNHTGALGLWRASNSTFLYSLLHRTTDAFLRSLLLTVLGLPENLNPLETTSAFLSKPSLIPDLSETASPLTGLLITTLASTLTGLLLSPLDLVRTKLILTPLDHAPRSTLANLKSLPSLLPPLTSILALPTILHHALPSFLSTALPLFARSHLSWSPETTPSLWPMLAFSTSIAELFVRLPLETVLRRAQIGYLKATYAHRHRHAEAADSEMPTVVPVAPYTGFVPTVRGILYAEGEVATKDSKGMVRVKRGQGVSGLVRGWRVGFWGIVGVWGAGALGGGAGGGGGARGEF